MVFYVCDLNHTSYSFATYLLKKKIEQTNKKNNYDYSGAGTILCVELTTFVSINLMAILCTVHYMYSLASGKYYFQLL